MLARLLLSHAADPNVEGVNAETHLSLTFWDAAVKTCHVLLDAGAEVPAVFRDAGLDPADVKMNRVGDTPQFKAQRTNEFDEAHLCPRLHLHVCPRQLLQVHPRLHLQAHPQPM